MGIDITSWRQRIGAYTPRSVTSPTKHTVRKTKPPSRNLVTTSNNKDISFLCIFLLFILVTAGIHLLALEHRTHRTPRSIEGYTHEVHLTFVKQTKSFFCYASTPHISRHSTALLLIAQSMDVHPNPGPTAIHIIRDLTTPHQRKLFNNAKRLQLKVTRYEHHISNYNYYRTHKIIPKGLSIKCRPSFDTDDQHFLRGWRSLLRKTSFQMMNLLNLTYQEHYKKTKIKLRDSLEQLKSTCPSATFRNITVFLKATVTELCKTLDSRRCKKRTFNGKYSSQQALHSHNRIITSSNATDTDRDTSLTPINTATTLHANHNTPHPHKRRRRRRRNIRTTRYWRRNNHNIQLDTNSVINLSNVTLSHDETQLLARGLTFCPMPQQIDWNEVRADITSFPDACVYWNISMTFLLRSTLTLSTSKAPGHHLNIGTQL